MDRIEELLESHKLKTPSQVEAIRELEKGTFTVVKQDDGTQTLVPSEGRDDVPNMRFDIGANYVTGTSKERYLNLELKISLNGKAVADYAYLFRFSMYSEEVMNAKPTDPFVVHFKDLTLFFLRQHIALVKLPLVPPPSLESTSLLTADDYPSTYAERLVLYIEKGFLAKLKNTRGGGEEHRPSMMESSSLSLQSVSVKYFGRDTNYMLREKFFILWSRETQIQVSLCPFKIRNVLRIFIEFFFVSRDPIVVDEVCVPLLSSSSRDAQMKFYWAFRSPRASRLPTRNHSMILCFEQNGMGTFYLSKKAGLAVLQKPERVLPSFFENPSLLESVMGAYKQKLVEGNKRGYRVKTVEKEEIQSPRHTIVVDGVTFWGKNRSDRDIRIGLLKVNDTKEGASFIAEGADMCNLDVRTFNMTFHLDMPGKKYPFPEIFLPVFTNLYSDPHQVSFQWCTLNHNLDDVERTGPLSVTICFEGRDGSFTSRCGGGLYRPSSLPYIEKERKTRLAPIPTNAFHPGLEDGLGKTTQHNYTQFLNAMLAHQRKHIFVVGDSLEKASGDSTIRLFRDIREPVIGFRIDTPIHVFAAVYFRDEKRVEMLDTATLNDSQKAERESLLDLAFIGPKNGVRVVYLFDKDRIDLQKYEDGAMHDPAIHDLVGTFGGQCANWAFRMLYRRLVLDCSLEEIASYFRLAPPVSQIYSLNSFIRAFGAASDFFANRLASKGSINPDGTIRLPKGYTFPPPLTLDVPCEYTERRGEKLARKRIRT